MSELWEYFMQGFHAGAWAAGCIVAFILVWALLWTAAFLLAYPVFRVTGRRRRNDDLERMWV